MRMLLLTASDGEADPVAVPVAARAAATVAAPTPAAPAAVAAPAPPAPNCRRQAAAAAKAVAGKRRRQTTAADMAPSAPQPIPPAWDDSTDEEATPVAELKICTWCNEQKLLIDGGWTERYCAECADAWVRPIRDRFEPRPQGVKHGINRCTIFHKKQYIYIYIYIYIYLFHAVTPHPEGPCSLLLLILLVLLSLLFPASHVRPGEAGPQYFADFHFNVEGQLCVLWLYTSTLKYKSTISCKLPCLFISTLKYNLTFLLVIFIFVFFDYVLFPFVFFVFFFFCCIFRLLFSSFCKSFISTLK